MAEADEFGDIGELNKKDIEKYYSRGPRFSTAACTAKEMSRFCDDIGVIMDSLHPEILARYYGCGLAAPDMLYGLDVLDLGCGVGVDCFILSKLVGAGGHVIGIDMTQEQLTLANKYRVYHSNKFGYARPNTLFVKGYIEDLKSVGLMDASKDIVVSNCVLSLSFDKEAVLKEAARVLKPGGEMFFSDMYTNKPVPEELKKDETLWGEGYGGALHWEKLCELAKKAGFCEPVMYECEDLEHHDDTIMERIPGDLQYKAVTYRLFRLPQYPVNKTSSMKVTFYGGIKNSTFKFDLTSKIQLKKGESVIIPRELGESLRLSRYGKFLGFEINKHKDTTEDVQVMHSNNPYE